MGSILFFKRITRINTGCEHLPRVLIAQRPDLWYILPRLYNGTPLAMNLFLVRPMDNQTDDWWMKWWERVNERRGEERRGDTERSGHGWQGLIQKELTPVAFVFRRNCSEQDDCIELNFILHQFHSFVSFLMICVLVLFEKAFYFVIWIQPTSACEVFLDEQSHDLDDTWTTAPHKE